MTGLDQLERSLKAADPVGAGGDPEPDLIQQAQAIMDHDPTARPVALRRRRRRLAPLVAAAGVLAMAIAVAFAVLPNSGDTGLPRPVAAFANQLDERKGVLHLRTAPERPLPEPGLPDLPDMGFADEVWLDLGGSGWRSVRTIYRGPDKGDTNENYADERGVHAVRHSEHSVVPPERLKSDYLRDPWANGVIAEPLELVRNGQLEVVGDETINGTPAYVVVVKRNDPKVVPETGDDLSNVRIYIAKDDGALLRVQFRWRMGIWDPRKPDDQQSYSMRTVVRDYPVYEILAPTPENLALTRPPADR
jgi:hypothetical protein